MVIEVVGIVCGTIAFLWVFTIVLAGLVVRSTNKIDAVKNMPTLDEVFAQAKSFIDGIDG